METETSLSLVGEETLRIFSDRDAESVRTWVAAGSICKISAPLRCLDLIKEMLNEFSETCTDALRTLPDTSLIDRLILLPDGELNSACHLQNVGSRYNILIRVPYSGISLRTDLLKVYGEILEDILPVSRYIFELAYSVQPVLKEDSPAFSNSSALWNFLILSLCSEPISDTELKSRPLLSITALDAIVRSLENVDKKTPPQTKAKFISMKEHLKRVALPVVLDKLLHLSNEGDSDELRQRACKLILHLGSQEYVERIKEAKSLSFAGEPVGETILQQLEHLSCLEELDLSDTYFPSEALRHLSQLPHLRVLNLQGTRAHNNAAVHLSKNASIEKMDCSYSQINDEGARHFLSYKKLKEVDITGTQVSNKVCDLLRQAGIKVNI